MCCSVEVFCLDSDIRKILEPVAKKWYYTKSLDDHLKAVRECLANHDYLTVYEPGVGGPAAEIDVIILQALMKGMMQFMHISLVR